MVSIGGAFAKSFGKNAAGELDDPILRAEMAAFDVDVFAYRAMGERFMDMWKTGRAHPASSNMMKYVGTELNKRRSEEHTSELQSLMRISYAVFCLKKKT